jgi:peptidoglycan/xylan/chitin deacetylase (PgdA/CDA1 family)
MLTTPRRRLLVTGAAQWLGVTPLLLAIERHGLGPLVRGVIYHSVPQAHAGDFERQLQYYQQHYAPVTHSDLAGLLATGEWPHKKPGLILSFDDGMRTHAEVAAPLIEKYGFCGWFFIPTEFLDTPEETQRQYARDHQISLNEDLPGPRVAMTWDQARALAVRHVVGGHSASHVRLSAKLTPEELDREIPQAKRYLEGKLGQPVDSFAWVGGQEWSYSESAARVIRDAGFRYSFMTNSRYLNHRSSPLQLDRCQVEPHWPLCVVRWQLSMLMDAIYFPRRRRVHRITRVN